MMSETRPTRPYDPGTAALPCYTDAARAFPDGGDGPRAFLERCLETIAAREPEVRAFAHLDPAAARAAADAAEARYRAGRPLSPVDGMPVAVKDVIDTADMPTEYGSPLFAGHRPKWDAACVHFLRRGGAVILGKTVTTEFAFAAPGPTRNPWDAARTPGGSSSGSGAAVGAAMAPVALGTQGRASVLRPAGFCGAWALKPTQGAINMLGVFPVPGSINHLGVFAGTIADMWVTARWLSHAAGGDPGHPSIVGPPDLPDPVKPRRIARLETAGWVETPGPVRDVFGDTLAVLADRGVEISDRAADPEIEALERDLVTLREVILTVLGYEMRWPLMMYAERAPEKLSQVVRDRAAGAGALTAEHYAAALAWADGLRARHAALADRYDAFLTLSAPGPAPEGMPVGSVTFGEPSSLLRVPALNAPLMAHDGMPLGLQILGFHRRDAELTAIGRWIADAVSGMA